MGNELNGAPETTPGSPSPELTLTPNGQTPHGSKTPLESLPPDVREYIERLRTEAKGSREESKGLRTELENITRVKQQAEETRLQEQGEYRKLAEQYQDQNKQLQAELAKRDQELAQQKHEMLRASIAAKHGLPPALAARLVGSNEQELEADAQTLKQFAEQAARPGNVSNPEPGVTPEAQQKALLSKMKGRYGRM